MMDENFIPNEKNFQVKKILKEMLNCIATNSLLLTIFIGIIFTVEKLCSSKSCGL